MDIEKQKAHELVDRGRCVKQGDGTWLVYSLSSPKRYKVTLFGQHPETGAQTYHACTCPTFELRQDTCKHIRACLAIVHGREPRDGAADDAPVSRKRPTYRQPDWAAYTEAQCNEKLEFLALLSDLCAGITEPQRESMRGRPPVPLAAQVFGACFKVYTGLSGRRFMTDMRQANESGYVDEAVHFNAIARFFEEEKNAGLLKAIVNASALPLKALETKFAADSTGFSGSRFARWYDRKYGRMQAEHVWCKAHAMVGTLTNCITAAEVLDEDTADSPQLAPLVKKTAVGFKIEEVSADKAYSAAENFDIVGEFGGTLYAAFKVNATGGVGGRFQDMYHRFCLAKDDYLRRYHLRSNAESSFSAVKRLFGDSVRSRTNIAMRNEVYAKFICYNLTCVIHTAYELGIWPSAFSSKLEPELKILKFPG